MGSPQQQPASTPAEVGQALAYYAVQLACGKSGKDILRLLNAEWGLVQALTWGKSRRRHVRAFLEVLAFCAWLCQHTEQDAEFLKAFYSYLESSALPEWKALVANTAPVQVEGLVWGVREFLMYRCYQYGEARKLGPNSILESARILTRDVPDLKVEPMALLKLSLMMSAMFTAHLPIVANIARQVSDAKKQDARDHPAHEGGSK